MQIKTINVNAAGLMSAGQGIQGARNQMQPPASMFGPECRVTISKEGRDLSRQQTVSAEKETGSVAARSSQPRRQEGTKGLLESLTEMYLESGFTGEELFERVKSTYEEIQKRAQGGIQFSSEEFTEESKAALENMTQEMVNVHDIKVDPSRAQDLIQAAQEYYEFKR